MDNIYSTNKPITYLFEQNDPISYGFTEHNLGLGTYTSISTSSNSSSF